MASRNEATIAPPDNNPMCPLCGWHDRKLRVVGSTVTPEERLAIHGWARHNKPFPWSAAKAPPTT